MKTRVGPGTIFLFALACNALAGLQQRISRRRQLVKGRCYWTRHKDRPVGSAEKRTKGVSASAEVYLSQPRRIGMIRLCCGLMRVGNRMVRDQSLCRLV